MAKSNRSSGPYLYKTSCSPKYQIETRRPPFGQGPTIVASTLSPVERW